MAEKKITLRESTLLLLLENRFKDGYQCGLEENVLEENRDLYIKNYANHHVNGIYTLICPFHHESRGSCLYDPDKKTYRCFGCGKEGLMKELYSELVKAKDR